MTDMPKVEKKDVCLAFVTKLASTVGLSKNLALNDNLNVRLIVSANKLIVFEVTTHLKDLDARPQGHRPPTVGGTNRYPSSFRRHFPTFGY